MGNLLVPKWSSRLFTYSGDNKALEGFLQSIIIVISTPCEFVSSSRLLSLCSVDSDPSLSLFCLFFSLLDFFAVLISAIAGQIANFILPKEAEDLVADQERLLMAERNDREEEATHSHHHAHQHQSREGDAEPSSTRDGIQVLNQRVESRVERDEEKSA